VENRRVGGKIPQRELCTLGRTKDPTLLRRFSALVKTVGRDGEAELLITWRAYGCELALTLPLLERRW